MMYIILVAFVVSLGFAFFLTPMLARVGIHCGSLDWPNSRKVHSDPIPRTGGLAIFLVFLLGNLLIGALVPSFRSQLDIQQTAFFFLGGGVVFGIGLIDDFVRLGYRVKFLFQILAASIAFWGGIRIELFYLGDFSIHFEYLSYFVTVAWFLLLVNAINLIDGLDGLAGGIIFFVSTVMLILLLMQGFYAMALAYAILAGAILGFLFYNFNPARVFLGDSGSYFLGYAMAALSIMGSVKSQMSTAVFLPIVLLGIPILDTCIAPLRRLCNGKKMFFPDKGHVHHRLLKIGLSTYTSMWVLYLATLMLCLVSLFLVNFRKPVIGMVLIASGVALVLLFQALRFLEDSSSSSSYHKLKKNIFSFFGMSSYQSRDYESDLLLSKDHEELWGKLISILDDLHVDQAELHLPRNGNGKLPSDKGRYIQIDEFSPNKKPHFPFFRVWSRNGGISDEEKLKEYIYKYEKTISDLSSSFQGSLVIIKDTRKGALPQENIRIVRNITSIFCKAFMRHKSLQDNSTIED